MGHSGYGAFSFPQGKGNVRASLPPEHWLREGVQFVEIHQAVHLRAPYVSVYYPSIKLF